MSRIGSVAKAVWFIFVYLLISFTIFITWFNFEYFLPLWGKLVLLVFTVAMELIWAYVALQLFKRR